MKKESKKDSKIPFKLLNLSMESPTIFIDYKRKDNQLPEGYTFPRDLDRRKIIEVYNGTTTVYIDTPKGWKCPRKGCTSDFKHSHSTYSSLFKK